MLPALSLSVKGQHTTAYRDSLEIAKNLVYQNPTKAVLAGERIYSNAGADTELKLEAIITVSSAYFFQKKINMAMEKAQSALVLAKENGLWTYQIKIYGLISNNYQVLNLNDKARFYINKAENIIKTHTLPNDLKYLEGNIYAVKGNSYKNDLDCDYAILYFDKAINCFKDINTVTAKRNLDFVSVQKSYCLISTNKPDAAGEILRQIVRNTSAVYMFETWGYAEIGLGKIEIQKSNYGAALEYLQEALKQMPENARIDIKEELYQNLATAYMATNDFANHKKFYSQYLKTSEESYTINAGSFDIVFQELSKEIENHQTELQNTSANYIALYIALALAILVFLGFLILKKEKSTRVLKQRLFHNSQNQTDFQDAEKQHNTLLKVFQNHK